MFDCIVNFISIKFLENTKKLINILLTALSHRLKYTMSNRIAFFGKDVSESLTAQPDYYSLLLYIKPLGETKKDNKIVGEFQYNYGGGQGEIIQLTINYNYDVETHKTIIETDYKEKHYLEEVDVEWEEGDFPFKLPYDKKYTIYHDCLTIKKDSSFHKIMDDIKPNSLFQMIEGETMFAEFKGRFYSQDRIDKMISEKELSKSASEWNTGFQKRIKEYYESKVDDNYSDEHISVENVET